MSVYYNENNPEAAAWLRELIKQRCIPDGVVDTRSIEDVRPVDLIPFTQCHFFAGIGGWAYALSLAGWGDRPVWTASCPCQPFSAAGKAGGFADERHLWPALYWLVDQCRPLRIVGEQVSSPAGRQWFDLVATDYEAIDYACWAAVVPAASVKAPHLRVRLYWMADASDLRRLGRRAGEAGDGRQSTRREPERLRIAGELADAGRGSAQPERLDVGAASRGDESEAQERERVRPDHQAGGVAGGLAESGGERREGLGLHVRAGGSQSGVLEAGRSGEADGFWDACDWLPCRDGKWRPVEPRAQQMAHGISRGVGLLRDLSTPEKETIDAAARTRFRNEVVSALRHGVRPEEIWQTTGRRVGFPATSLLLASLCEHERELGSVFYGAASRVEEVSETGVRALRIQASPACTPSGWEPSQQLADELRNALPDLSQAGASLVGFNGSPLGYGLPARVGRLRGYGNAIVPQLAAAFLEAIDA